MTEQQTSSTYEDADLHKHHGRVDVTIVLPNATPPIPLRLYCFKSQTPIVTLQSLIVVLDDEIIVTAVCFQASCMFQILVSWVGLGRSVLE